jgi:hypothetical protein
MSDEIEIILSEEAKVDIKQQRKWYSPGQESI